MKTNKFYMYSTLMLMLILPIISIIIQMLIVRQVYDFWDLAGKWFIFWAIGIRLMTAGFKQVINPEFTLESIFIIKNNESHVIVRELGFSNICKGSMAVISLFVPQWRIPAAFIGGVYLGIAGIQHIINKPVSFNEIIAMFSDIFISIIMVTYIFHMI